MSDRNTLDLLPLRDSGCCWASNVNGKTYWTSDAELNLGTRSDSHTLNSCPVTTTVSSLRCKRFPIKHIQTWKSHNRVKADNKPVSAHRITGWAAVTHILLPLSFIFLLQQFNINSLFKTFCVCSLLGSINHFISVNFYVSLLFLVLVVNHIHSLCFYIFCSAILFQLSVYSVISSSRVSCFCLNVKILCNLRF